jgi:hypothetical protein
MYILCQFDQIDPISFREVALTKVKIKLSPLKNPMNILKHVMYFICKKKLDQIPPTGFRGIELTVQCLYHW